MKKSRFSLCRCWFSSAIQFICCMACVVTLWGCGPTESPPRFRLLSGDTVGAEWPVGAKIAEQAVQNFTAICGAGLDLIGGMCIARPACDGKSDDTAVLQSRIDASVGGTLVIAAAAAPCLVTGLTIPSNTHLTINAMIQLAPNSNTDGVTNSILWIFNANDITIDGDGTLDGNRAHQNGKCCAAGLSAWLGTNLTVQGLTIMNVQNWPINVVTWNTAHLENLVLLNSGNSVEFAAETTNGSATGLLISGIDDEGFAFYGGVSNSSLTNSISLNNSADGVSVLNDAAQPSPSHDLLIHNVESFGNAIGGISIASGPGGMGSSSNIQISDCRTHANAYGDVRNVNGTNVSVTNLRTDGGTTSLSDVTGVIDGIFQNSDGGYTLAGWACAIFVPDSISVDLYLNAPAGSPGAIGIARFSAKVVSEPEVAQACQSNGTSYRFLIPVPPDWMSKYPGALIYLHGISPWRLGGTGSFTNNLLARSGLFQIPPACKPGTYSHAGSCQPPGSIVGWVEGVFNSGGTYSVNGWACAQYDPNPIQVALYLGGPAGSPGSTGIAWYPTGQQSEPPIATSCLSYGAAYRFSIPLTSNLISLYAGKAIYVHGISPNGNPNNLMNGSGAYFVP